MYDEIDSSSEGLPIDSSSPHLPRQESNVVVTGAASGIGLAVVRRFLNDGATVTALDIRCNKVADLPTSLACHGAKIRAVCCDVTQEEAVAAAIQEVATTIGDIDVLVTCAGATTYGVIHETTLADWSTILNINATGVFLSVKHAIPYMCRRGGAIVTIGSISSLIIGAGGGSACYEASKAAVLQITRAAAVEYASVGIRANCVSPGSVDTTLALHARELLGDTMTSKRTQYRQKHGKTSPQKRQAHPDEIAGIVAFLASNDASFITGANIVADGGYTII
jgi:NAD(P)-dependent dehydrogenase (short-subunit alcohol dehydrogenase family)